MSLPNEFFTVAGLTTLAGSTAVVVVVTATIGYLSDGKIKPKWTAFILAELVSFVGAFALTAPPENVALAVRILIALVNGCLVFATAVGLNTITTKPPSGAPGGTRKRLWSRW